MRICTPLTYRCVFVAVCVSWGRQKSFKALLLWCWWRHCSTYSQQSYRASEKEKEWCRRSWKRRQWVLSAWVGGHARRGHRNGKGAVVTSLHHIKVKQIFRVLNNDKKLLQIINFLFFTEENQLFFLSPSLKYLIYNLLFNETALYCKIVVGIFICVCLFNCSCSLRYALAQLVLTLN